MDARNTTDLPAFKGTDYQRPEDMQIASVGKRETSDKVTQRLEGTTIVLSGVLRGQPAYEMRIAPVVGADGAVALWKCTSTTLTGRWMPSQCRPGRSG